MRFTLSKIEIAVGYEAVAALAMVLLLDHSGRTVSCLIAAALHESGHLLMMLLRSCHIRRITVRLFDVQILSDEPKSRRDDLLITAMGVITNFLSAGIFSLFWRRLALSNLVIGVFNLLPIGSLDGGHLMRLLLSGRMSYRAVDRIEKILSFVFLIPFFFLGIFVLLRTKYNYSLLAVSLYLLAVLLLKREFVSC